MHAINIISGISMLGVLIGSAALIIILSVFNGFEVTILSLNGNFSPEIQIEPRLGKTFDPNTAFFNSLAKDPRVFSCTQVLQEKALIKYETLDNSDVDRIMRGDVLTKPTVSDLLERESARADKPATVIQPPQNSGDPDIRLGGGPLPTPG